MGRHRFREFWEHWQGTPGWIWTASVLAYRGVTHSGSTERGSEIGRET
jgi:hypothetical protein